MYRIIKDRQYNELTIKDMSTLLKLLGCIHSLKNREKYLSRLDTYSDCLNFSWRIDQKEVIKAFAKFTHKHYVIHAVFGSGKTTLLLGMLIHGLIKRRFKPDKVLFLSFNLSIRNEIKRKLKSYGLASKISVRTFDSVVYEIAKIADYPYIELPNFDGKRRFVYEKTFDENFNYIPTYQPDVIFIDECQDLEKNTLKILHKFYPNSKFIFSGDIFQSIQKEPRESILWHFMTTDIDNTYKIYMKETPRVPLPILNSIQTALNAYYPEFKEKINSWTSGNTISSADIVWNRLDSYNDIFDKILKFTTDYRPEEGMILTFSSAITVRGCMGDVARIRRFLVEHDIPVNTNHKKLDPDTFFLSTANSSKGLERDYVIIFLTFPLERAFINLSDDIVVNLITVALSRAKKKVFMYVPSYEDKFSRVLNIFQNCPQPDKKRLRDDKTVKEFNFSDFLNLEHSVTELIRMSIVKYDTRIDLKKFTKTFHFSKIFGGGTDSFGDDVKYNILPIITEEERAFVGVLIENLITSTWTGKWADMKQFEGMDNNPMYNHVSGIVKRTITNYRNFVSRTIFDSYTQFQGIYYYSQIHTAISNKIYMNLAPELKENLQGYWNILKNRIIPLKPSGKKLSIQANLQMPWVTGVADAIVTRKKGEIKSNEIKSNEIKSNEIKSNETKSNETSTLETDEIEIIEIKASQEYDWKDNALLQAIIYALMSGKTWSRIHLLNPFRNEKVSYYFDSKKIMYLRQKVIDDVLLYNLNSFMAKMYGISKTKEPKKMTDSLIIDFIKEDEKIKSVSIINIVSPIKCELLYHSWTKNNKEKEKGMEKIEKFRVESEKDEEDIMKEVKEILESKMNCDKQKYGIESNKELAIQGINVTYDEMIKNLDYKKDDEKPYSLESTNSLHRNIVLISYLFNNYKFV
jgi:hypothetical protein